ncbi:alpha-mannosidase [Rossellomorea sp. BNER]|uniref:alpha-mannosidase n=1 Tax=Rossellomorea sp. BNER TaxID=2962031 RepID=UPI003AF2BC49|nr:alpha-mannosidase [Rossellomorea sp. BNER]
MTEQRKAHIISHSHWDREWYLPFEKHRFYLVKLMDTLLDLFASNSGFQSFHLDGQTILLEDYLAIRPHRKEELKKYIQEKRIHIGPWYVLQDAFLTSSEANIRNLLYGLQDAKEYGQVSKIGYFPDTFGIYGQAPQILKQAGIDAATFGRGVKPTGFNNTVSDAVNFESPFSELKWESPDGSSVLGILFANWYSNGNEIPTDPSQAEAFWQQKLKDAEKYASTHHLLYMNGCDHQPVQTDIPEALKTANELYPNIEFVHSNFDEYVQEVQQSLPGKLQTIKGELRNQRTDGWSTLVNTASARIYLKQMNQVCQTLLEKVAEPLSVFAHLLGDEYPRDYLRYAWKTLMQNHPHDSICGCSVDEVHQEMVTRFKKVQQTAEMIITEKAEQMASKINTSEVGLPEGTIPLVVFNTSGNKRDMVIEKVVEIEKVYFSNMHFSEIRDHLMAKEVPNFTLVDSMKNEIPHTIEDLGVQFGYDLPDDAFRQPYFARKVKVIFPAEQLPQLGYQTYFLTESQSTNSGGSLLKDERTLENQFVQVVIHDNGSYTLKDKQTGKIYDKLGIYENTSDIGNEYMFKKPASETPLTTEHLRAEIRVIEDSSIRSSIEIKHVWEIPKETGSAFEEEKHHLVWHPDRNAARSNTKTTLEMVTNVMLETNAKGPKVKVTIHNQSKDHRLRVLFPSNAVTDHHFADSIFEVVKRPNHPEIEWENPSFDHHQQAFVSVSDEHAGLTIANKGLNEYEILENDTTIAVTILRSVSELGDWGYFPTPEAQCLGENHAEFMIIPHQGSVIDSEAYKVAYDFQIPDVTRQTDIHQGTAPLSREFVSWEGNQLAFSTMKLAEEKDDIVVRYFNPSTTDSLLSVQSKNAQLYYQSNIIEECTREIGEQASGQTVRPFEIYTIGISTEE